jgi:hypothetical protein
MEAANMEKLRRCDVMAAPLYRPMSYLCHAQSRPKSWPAENALELHATIHFFAVLSRFITEIERAATLGFKYGFPVSRI